MGSIPIVKAFLRRFLVQNLATGHMTGPHIWILQPRFAYSLYNLHGATMTFKDVPFGGPENKILHFDPHFGVNFVSTENFASKRP